jgi:hypothetical protein
LALLIWQVLLDALIAIGFAINHFWPPLALYIGRCGFTDTTLPRLEVLNQDGRAFRITGGNPRCGKIARRNSFALRCASA